MKYLRFDEKSQRKTQRVKDKFSMVRSLWEKFIENSIACYRPDKFLTVDEQLVPSKNRCSFLQFMPKKPDKFGIKFWLLVDVESKYICNGYPYLGKESDKPANELQGEYIVKKLIEPYKSKGHCVTTDNFFSSLKLARSLLKVKTTFIGTMKKNKRELPPRSLSLLSNHATLFLEDENGSLLSTYQGRPKKSVIMLTTEIEQAVVPELSLNQKMKPTSVLTYNSKKCGVDCVDQMTRLYSVKSATRRWPICVFYNILNLAIINSWILYRKVNGKKISRRKFIIALIENIKENRETLSRPASKRRAMSCSEVQSPFAALNFGDDDESEIINIRAHTCQIAKCAKYKASTVCFICKKKSCGSCIKKTFSVCLNCETPKE